ncbi:hypothetical protein A2V82_09830 [candidate division KSB1 bacterium RBG_16_48_16]|nr:MAG: hypothetical protein A2V82_09830 [candidate division KSB1 bacterium RBG_16_48_16]
MKKSIKRTHIIYFAIITLAMLNCAGSNKTGKLSFVSEDEEITLGKSLVGEASKQFNVIRNQEITDFINNIAREIGVQSDWSALPYQVYIVNSPDLNHFSLPGGSIFIFRGLIEISETASEVALIIAHEMAHISARDGIDQLSEKYSYAFAAQSVMGENPEIPAQIIADLYYEGTILDYGEDKEYLADKRGLKYAWKANYDPTGLTDILERIGQAESVSPESVELLYTTHPSASDRLRRAKMEIDQIPQKASLRKDLDEFHNIKELLARLPQ